MNAFDAGVVRPDRPSSLEHVDEVLGRWARAFIDQEADELYSIYRALDVDDAAAYAQRLPMQLMALRANLDNEPETERLMVRRAPCPPARGGERSNYRCKGQRDLHVTPT